MMIYGKHSVAGVLQFRPQLVKKVWEGESAEILDLPVTSGKAWDFGRKKVSIYVCVDHVEDPQNLGAIARAAALLGAHALVFPQDRQAGITPAVIKASAGLIFALDLIKVPNLGAFLQKFKKETQGWVYGLQAEHAEPLGQHKGASPCALVVGSEEKGISKSTAAMCDAFYAIPMTHAGHSLNVSQATAIGLYQLVKQEGVV